MFRMKKVDNFARRFPAMLVGNVALGVGIGLFKLSGMGNDPHSAMVMAIGAKVGLPFSGMVLFINCLWFAFELLFGRRYVGIGTFFNWAFVGVVTDLFVAGVRAAVQLPGAFLLRLPIMVGGVLVVSLGASLYQTADMGIAPYDALSIILRDRTPVPYFWCRMFTDCLCAVVAFLMGGLLGLGSLCCALGLGPFIAFFDRNLSKKIM